jgi:hypothetical protein
MAAKKPLPSPPTADAPVVRPSLAVLEQELAERRNDYLAAIDAATGPSGREKSQHLYGTPGLTPFMTLAEQWLALQREKLRYEASSGRVQEWRDRNRQDAADVSQRRFEALQASMTRGTWVIAAFTVLAALAAIGALLLSALKTGAQG